MFHAGERSFSMEIKNITNGFRDAGNLSEQTKCYIHFDK